MKVYVCINYPTAGMLIGGPSAVVNQVGAFQDAGVRRLNIAIRPPVDWDALQAFVEEVMPKFES